MENTSDKIINETDEALITAWVRLTGVLKNGRLTEGLMYNEAIVMLIAYKRFLRDGEGLVSFSELVNETHMLKSHMHRTIASLTEKRLLEKVKGTDRRTTFVRPIKENLEAFLKVHANSLEIAKDVRRIIGDDDVNAFLRISDKIYRAYSHPSDE